MYKNLLLGLFTAALLIGDVQAQSGSGSRNSNNAAAMRRKERAEASAITKIAKKIEKTNFEGIKLETTQKRALKELVKEKFDGLASIELKMERLIPEDKASDLRRKYSAALRKGSTEDEAMILSMQEVEFPQSLQDKIMTLSGEADEVHQEIASELSEQLNPEQKEAFMAMAKEKEMASGAKEMNGAGSGTKTMEGDGSGAKKMEGEGSDSKAIENEGSGSKTMEADGSGLR